MVSSRNRRKQQPSAITAVDHRPTELRVGPANKRSSFSGSHGLDLCDLNQTSLKT